MDNRHTHRRTARLGVFIGSALIALGMAVVPAHAQRAPRRLVLCLDGTWNSTFGETTRADGTKVLRPTNPLKICRAVLPQDSSGRAQITYYDIGVGSLAEYEGTANRLLRFSDRILGGAYGAGLEANVEDALHFIQLNYEEGDEVYIFGFSRGSATARAVTQFLEWNNGVFAKDDAYYLPRFFREFVEGQGTTSAAAYREAIIKSRRPEDVERNLGSIKPSRPVPVTYLGVFDTVAALDSRFKAKGDSTSAPGRSFLTGKKPASCIVRARQALAIDEARFDFRPELWVESHPNQTIEQRWFAGVHSNVGGGYRHDGLANIALKWIVEGAQGEHHEGLQLDQEYLKHFRRLPSAELYDSSSALYRLIETIRFRKGKGKRPIAGINAELSHSVIARIATPGDKLLRDTTKGAKNTAPGPYRPENVLQFLACRPDLDAYLRSIPFEPADRETMLTIDSLPADARSRIDQLRKNCGG